MKELIKKQDENFYGAYHEICLKKKDDYSTSAELKNTIDYSRCCKEKLLGMVLLMKRCDLISEEEGERETDKIIKEFSSIELYNAFINEDGEVYCFVERSCDSNEG